MANLINGEIRPEAGKTYQYSLSFKVFSVRWTIEIKNKPKTIKVVENGLLRFIDSSVGNTYIIRAWYKMTSTDIFEIPVQQEIICVAGTPSITYLVWQDKDKKDIKGNVARNRDQTYYLYVKTSNIPQGDKIHIQIYEKDLTEVRKVGKESQGIVPANKSIRFKFTPELLKAYAKELDNKDFINDQIHQFIAKITYGKTTIGESEQLWIRNTDKPSTLPKPNIPTGNKSVAINRNEKSETSEETEKIDLKIHVFFDGTRGNKFNVEVRNNPDKYYDVEQKDGTIKREKGQDILNKHAKDETNDTSSYNQSYTSITNLYDLNNDIIQKNTIKIYIEGVGSTPYGSDGSDLIEAGMAIGSMDIDSKLNKAISEITIRKNRQYENKQIKTATVTVFGFSRGATTARSFVSKKMQQELVKALKIGSISNITYNFVGIFDTVSTVIDGKDDVKSYELNLGAKAQKVLHLTAGNEYRKKFALTDIRSAINAGCGYEFCLPGDHSDIGGGHLDNIRETVKTTDIRLIDKLTSEGWHTADSKTSKTTTQMQTYSISVPTWTSYESIEYTVTRVVRNEYRYIPLEIMMNYAQKHGKVIFKSNPDYSVKSPDLLDVRKKIMDFVQRNNTSGSHSAMSLIQGDELKNLRHKYLHLSAGKEKEGDISLIDDVSMGGRYDKSGKPSREIIPG